MKLTDLLTAVQEKNLTKTQLEEYRDDLANLYARMQIELADVRKEKAIYIWEVRSTQPQDKPASDKAVERQWQVTSKGLREIELSHYSKGVEKVLSSLKSRLYSTY